MKRLTSIYLLISLFSTVFIGCRKLVEVGAPITNPTSESVYTSDGKAASVLTSIYSRISGSVFIAHGQSGISITAGLTADELETYPSVGGEFMNAYTNSPFLQTTNTWNELYQAIYVTNAAIEGITNSPGGITDSTRNRLIGEAKFMRAFLHFYLINMYGDAPLVTTANYKTNEHASRTPKDQVYKQIILDLKDAESLLKSNYVTPAGATTTERVRPNKGAATALLARVYLYTGDWQNAEAEATQVLSNTGMYSLLADPDQITLKNNKEALWQLQPVLTNFNSYDGYVFILTAIPDPYYAPVALRGSFLENFEPGDKRKTAWVDSITLDKKYYFPTKYNVKNSSTLTEYTDVLRLAEVYLIRAEARAQQNKISDAQTDLNAIRTRAGLGATTANDKVSLLLAIEEERQVELFTEWGHRWFDLKRTGRIDAIMSIDAPKKGGTWNTDMQLYALPSAEILLNPNLAPQNPGYK